MRAVAPWRGLRLPCLLAVLLLPGPAPLRAPDVRRASPWTQSISRAWPVERAWDPAAEAEFSAFVAALGEAVAAWRCRTLAACLQDPGANLLYDPIDDETLNVSADCADLPYLLRAYFAFKKHLPFAFV